MASESQHKTNQALLAPVMDEILKLHATGRTWKEVCEYLEERGVVSSSGLPFMPSALRAYVSNHTRPKGPAPPTVQTELKSTLEAEHTKQFDAKLQRDQLARLMTEYIIARMQWTRGILAAGRRDVGYEYTNFQHRSRELRERIHAISPSAADIADRAGKLVTLLCFDLAAEPNMQISADKLTRLQISDREGLDHHVHQQYLTDNYRWELSMVAATPPHSR